jgi:hypothetical protein
MARNKPATIIQAMCNDNLLGRSFPDRESWSKWFTILRSIYGLPMSTDDLATFTWLEADRRIDPVRSIRRALSCSMPTTAVTPKR